MRPVYEEHAKMFAPLGFLPGATPAHIEAIGKRGGWYEAGVPTLESYIDTGAWFAGTPQARMLEQFQWVSEAVMRH